MAKNVLLGVKKFSSSKSGTQKDYEVIVVSSPFNARSVENGCFGSDVTEMFLPEKLHGRLTSDNIGHEIVLDYEITGTKAYLTGFSIK